MGLLRVKARESRILGILRKNVGCGQHLASRPDRSGRAIAAGDNPLSAQVTISIAAAYTLYCAPRVWMSAPS